MADLTDICNCIIGHIPDYEGNIFVYLSDNRKELKRIYKNCELKYFKYCPKCGREIFHIIAMFGEVNG